MKKLLGIPLLALIVAILCVPAVASAGSPFTPLLSQGAIITIDDGNVTDAGESGRWVVKEREVTGVFPGPGLIGPFTFTYGSNVPILTQSGNIHGTLVVGAYKAKVRGTSSLMGGGFCLEPDPSDGVLVVPFVILGVDGSFAFTAGTQGRGTFGAVVWANIDGAGHITGILPAGESCYDPSGNPLVTGPSGVSIDGKWKQP